MDTLAHSLIQNDKQIRKGMIMDTIYETCHGMFKNYQKIPSLKHTFNTQFNVGEINKICIVEVINKHALEVAESSVNTAVLNVVDFDFSGNLFSEIDKAPDYLINIRTTFNNITNNPYPVKNDECIYTIVSIIKSNDLLTFINGTKIALLTISTSEQQLNNKIMSSDSFISTCSTMETIFQTAIDKKHTTLILSSYGEHHNYPIDDVIKIYNYCLLKYGHLFKKIIFAIPSLVTFEIYNSSIIRPQNID